MIVSRRVITCSTLNEASAPSIAAIYQATVGAHCLEVSCDVVASDQFEDDINTAE